ncbi:MAG: Jag N-terminal domain-containing protein, partial [Clostridia bacterium]|nr:Jag N-terminal domain-containing protein [Clostridia bacterium]
MQFTGKTVNEAIETGLKELNVTEEKAEITVIEQPTTGLFGILKGKAVVEIVKKQTEAEATVEFVQGIIDIMGLNAKATLTSDGDSTVITLGTEDSSSVIGYR